MVLDTNAVLDVLAFKTNKASALAAALASRQLIWLASAYMRQELEFTLARPLLARYAFDRHAVLAAYDALTDTRPAAATHPRLRCRDGDDQPFIDLALAEGACWLVTSDRDLLVLAKRARRLGLSILGPQAWPACSAE